MMANGSFFLLCGLTLTHFRDKTKEGRVEKKRTPKWGLHQGMGTHSAGEWNEIAQSSRETVELAHTLHHIWDTRTRSAQACSIKIVCPKKKKKEQPPLMG